jgi:hypothetical protein
MVTKVEIGTFLYQTKHAIMPTLLMGNFLHMADGRVWFHPFNGMLPREVIWQ